MRCRSIRAVPWYFRLRSVRFEFPRSLDDEAEALMGDSLEPGYHDRLLLKTLYGEEAIGTMTELCARGP